MRLFLYHGRDTPDEELQDWGFDGPELFGISFYIVTYFTHIRFGFKDRESFERAKELTGWEVWDDLQLLMKTHNDLVEANGKFYGDWCLDEEEPPVE